MVRDSAIALGAHQFQFDHRRFEQAVKRFVASKLPHKSPIMADEISALLSWWPQKGLHADGPPTIFRTYTCEGYSASKCAIWQAMRATSATPLLFQPMNIEIPKPGGIFVDGGIGGHNNPSELALLEAQRIWPKVKRFTLVSIGSGRQQAVPLISNIKARGEFSSFVSQVTTRIYRTRGGSARQIGLDTLLDACTKLTINSEPVHQRMFRLSRSRDRHKQFSYHRLNVEREMEAIGFTEWKKLQEIGAHTAAFLQEGEGMNRRDNCVEDLMYPPPIESKHRVALVVTGLGIDEHSYIVRYQRNPYFTGREVLLCQLRDRLCQTNSREYNHRIALYGIAGVGKTQIAIEYLHRYERFYNGLYWVSATDQAMLISGFQVIATRTGCIQSTVDITPADIAKSVVSWLREQDDWLLVIDNLDDVTVVDGYLPDSTTGGHTLITTRNPNADGIPAAGIEIGVLSKDEAIDLLCLRSKPTEDYDEDVAEKIVCELGYLSLAIEQASAYIRETTGKMTEFLTIYHANRKSIHNWIPHGNWNYSYSVATTWLMSFEKIRREAPGAAELLQVLAFLNPDIVLLDFVKAGVGGLKSNLKNIVQNQVEFEKALFELERFSVIKRLRERNGVSLHRLVQAVVIDEMSKSRVDELWQEVIAMCDLVFPNHDDIPRCRVVQDQVTVPLSRCPSIKSLQLAETLRRVALYLEADAKIDQGEEFELKSVNIFIDLVGHENPSTLRALGTLASIWQNQGKLEESARLDEKILEMERHVLDKDDPGVLTTMSNLASTYWLQVKLEKAAELQEEVLKIREKCLGSDNPDTLTGMNNLAMTYYEQGRLLESCELQEKAVAGRIKVMGTEHPDSLTIMANLGGLCHELGRNDEGDALLEKVYRLQLEMFGENHVHRLKTMKSMAGIYERRGLLEDAVNHKRDVLTSAATPSVESVEAVIFSNSLASTYKESGRLADAVQLLESSIKLGNHVLGEKHLSILECQDSLVVIYMDLGRYEEAIRLAKRTLEINRLLDLTLAMAR